MNDRLLVDGACFERGCVCMSSSYHVHEIPDHAVWMHKEKEWVGLTKEDADSIECWFREEIENDRFSVENLIARIDAKLKEKNT